CHGHRTLFWCVAFFFSSRRRHTRFSRDWSSDVCSSDLLPVSPVRHTYPIVVPDGRRKVADDDQQVFRVLTLALVDDDAVFAVSVVDPLKSAMIKSILVQSLFRFVKPVQRNDEFAYALMEVIVKKMPVEAVVMIPL